LPVAVRQRVDELHVVLDDDQRVAALEREEKLGGALGLLVGHVPATGSSSSSRRGFWISSMPI
jgi:hypothetical protein